MLDRPSIAPGPSQPFGAELLKVWDVRADRTYDIRCNRPERHLVAIRTHAGVGRLHTVQAAPIELRPDTLILVESSHLKRYRCAASTWRFWWFEFRASDPLPCALNAVNPVAGQPSDDADFRLLFARLQHPSFPERCVASATFVAMLHRWLAETRLRRETTPHRRIVETMIERIHQDVAGDWSVARLAREAGLSETCFRKAFKRATGDTPAHFVRAARLQAASQMLQQGIYTLAAIAEQLNFSSAFHLSAAFKQHFGISPSDMKP